MTLELSILLKATVVLLLGLLAAQLSARARASVRHLLLAATLGALAALPLVAALAPALTVAVPVPASVSPLTTVIAPPQAAGGIVRSDVISEAASPAFPADDAPSLGAALRAVWVTGSVLLLGLLAHALWKVTRIRRTAIPWLAGQAMVDRLVPPGSRAVSVVVHEDVPAPVTCGWRHPAIVLPADAQEWSRADIERAMVHELEHVRRGDWLVQLAARVICAAYWFHPLVWVAWRRLCLECERACDDAVVAAIRLRQGDDGQVADTDYADQLVTLAGRLSQADGQPALSMARRSDLAVRVKAVLDRTQLRGRAGASAVIATVVMATAFSLILAPMRVQAVPGAAAEAAPAQTRRLGSVTASARAPRNGVLGRALVEAAIDDDLEAVRELLDAGADANSVVQGDGTALLIAAREGNRAIVDLLLDRGADIDIGVRGDGSALIMAAREGFRDIVRLFIDRGADVDIAVAGDGSPLIMAAREGFREITRMLIDAGADVNLAVPGDGNPLIMAAREGHIEITTMLLDRGARVNEVVPGDENAIIGASGEGFLDVVKLLVSRGADVNARVWAEHWDERGNRRGEWRTPLSRARREGQTHVVRYLQSVGAVD